jgi:hypothetical protein
MLGKFLLLLIFGFCLPVSTAWADSHESAIHRHSTTQGCAVFHKAPSTQARQFQWSGACEGGMAAGLGVLVWQSYDEYRKRWEDRWAGAGAMRAGKPMGWWLAPNRIGKHVLIESYEEGVRKGWQTFNPATVPDMTQWINSKTGGNASQVPYSYLLAALSAYLSNEPAFLKGQIPGDWQQDSNANQSSVQDDPKVRGRSARGG